MAAGITHDRFSLLIGAILCGTMAGLGFDFKIYLCFIFGWLVATLIFSPDTDVMPKKRTKILQFILYPYSILFKHRGISHSLLFGTITRFFYSFLMLGILTFVLHQMGKVNVSFTDYLTFLTIFFKNYNYNLLEYKMLTWLFIGAFGADLCHILLDHLTSFTRRLMFWK